ncbi:sodium-dependent transporter [Streptomyces mobaraensis]|uniref:sodium-dependent transporter n=1 Tax=Streptomyces mobaraensis TaxID=35621 RepID=UPI0033F1BE6E
MSHDAFRQPVSSPVARLTAWLRRRLGRAVTTAYLAAVALPGPGLWLRHTRTVPLPTGHLPVSVPAALLSLVLFSAGLQVPLRDLGRLLRRPLALLAGLALHLIAPLLVIPAVAIALHTSPDTDGGSGLVTAMILIVAMPVAAGATVWTGKGNADQPVMVGLVLASTLLSPFTIPLTMTALSPLLGGDYAASLHQAAHTFGPGFALTSVLLPCGAGILCRMLLPARSSRPVLHATPMAALWGSLLLTYVNASGALGSFFRQPRPLLLAAALTVATVVCALSFTLGHLAARLLRLEPSTGSSLTLACGMNNSSASAVLITTTLPDKPYLLLPVLAYGLLQKLAAGRIVRERPGHVREPVHGAAAA